MGTVLNGANERGNILKFKLAAFYAKKNVMSSDGAQLTVRIQSNFPLDSS